MGDPMLDFKARSATVIDGFGPARSALHEIASEDPV
jgi:hypothetical protein